MHELTQEQRIAGRLFPAGCAEGVLGVGREGLAQKQGGGGGTQGAGRITVASGSETIWPIKAGILSRFLRVQSHHDQEAEALHPWQEVGEPTQRGQIAPVQVVEREQSGLRAARFAVSQ